jgi:hypothetical protein
MSSNLLVLSPKDPWAVPDVVALTTALRVSGFMGEGLPEAGFYKPGEEFFQFITFLGCSPVVALGVAGKTAEICRIEISIPLEKPVFFAGTNLKAPRCPGCGHKSLEGRIIGDSWQHDPRQHRWTCPECGNAFSAEQLQWRHCAGFGRFFLKVWGIFEGEAVPGDHLLNLLGTHSAFGYFFVQT